MKRFAAADYALALLAGLLALTLYVRTLAPGVLGGDSGELQFAAWMASLPHPTGYPLFMLLGYAWTHLIPWGDPAWRMNLLTALCGALAVGLVYLLASKILALAGFERLSPGALRLLALLAAATFATTATFWSQSVVTEVYALQAVFVAGILLAVLHINEGQAPGRGASYVAAALFGLALAHHRTIILLAPAVALWLVMTRPAGVAWRVYLARLAPAALIAVLPLALYLYVPLAAAHTPYQRLTLGPAQTLELYQPTPAGFWQYVTGQVFGTAFRTPAGALAQMPSAFRLLGAELSWPGVALAFGGVIWLAWRRCWPLLALTATAFVAIRLFNVFYGIGDIYVYYIPSYLIAAVWCAVGAGAIAMGVVALLSRGAGERESGVRQPVVIFACALAALVLPSALLLNNYGRVDQSGNDAPGATWRRLLAQPIPQGAILVSNDRDEMMPMWYYQYVDGLRPDLTGLFPQIVPSADWADIGGVTDQALATGRPVFLIKPMPGLDIKYRLAAEGGLVRVQGKATTKAPDRGRGLVFGGVVRLDGYDVEPAMIDAGRVVTVTLYWQALQPLEEDYSSFVHLLDVSGEPAGKDDRRPGGVYYPSRLWQPGEVLRDVHQVQLKDGSSGSPYRILVGLYGLAPEVRNLGEPQTVGYLAQQRAADALPTALRPAAYTFGDQLALLGYEQRSQAQALDLTLYWQAVGLPERDYTFFVHVLDAGGKIVAQRDAPPLGGSLPTTAWPAGYRLADAVRIDMPPGLPAGQYRLAAGVYDSTTQAPLPVHGADSADGRANLGTVSWPQAPQAAR